MSRFLRKKRDKTFNFKSIRSLAELLWQHYAQETYGSGAIWNATICQITEQIGAKLPNAFILLVLDNKKKVAEISLDDQILLFIVQREAIVDITGTL